MANLATEKLAELSLAPVTRLGTEALAARSIYSCRLRLGYFGPVADAPGFPRALASTLSELRMEELPRDSLAAAGAAGKDLALLLECYEKELGARAIADYALMCRLGAEVALHSNHRLLRLPLLLLDVIPDSLAEHRFLRSVAGRAPSVFATALTQDEDGVARLEAQRNPFHSREYLILFGAVFIGYNLLAAASWPRDTWQMENSSRSSKNCSLIPASTICRSTAPRLAVSPSASNAPRLNEKSKMHGEIQRISPLLNLGPLAHFVCFLSLQVGGWAVIESAV